MQELSLRSVCSFRTQLLLTQLPVAEKGRWQNQQHQAAYAVTLNPKTKLPHGQFEVGKTKRATNQNDA